MDDTASDEEEDGMQAARKGSEMTMMTMMIMMMMMMMMMRTRMIKYKKTKEDFKSLQMRRC